MNSSIVPSPRPTRRWPYVVTAEQWDDAIRVFSGELGMGERTALSLHRYAISRAIFCPAVGCGRVMDIRRDVLYRNKAICRACFLDCVRHGTEKTGPERMREELLSAFVAGDLVDGTSFYTCGGRKTRKVKPPLAFALRILATDTLENAED